MEKRFKYADERDKAYGIAGMAISLVVWNEREALVSVSLDGEPRETFVVDNAELTSAATGVRGTKAAWALSVNNYQLSLGMITANALCRSYVLKGRSLSREGLDQLRTLAREVGAECCSLENDECDTIVRKCFNYFDQLFCHRAVQTIATDFTKALIEARTMSASDVFDHLSALDDL